MKLTKILLLFTLVAFISCEDDDGPQGPAYRDPAEVAQENHEQIVEYMETHFFELVDNPLNPNYQRVEFGKVQGLNEDKTPIMESSMLESKTVTRGEVDYTLYYLKIRAGAPEEYQPTFADEVVITYRGELFDGTTFDETVNPARFDLPGTGNNGFIPGFTEAINEFKGASSFEENGDGTVSYSDDFGIGAVFIPSGLAYFAEPPIGTPIAQYESLIFGFQLYKGIQTDHDNDGIPSVMEDLDDDGILLDFDDDTDGDRTPNYLDADDDGDGTPTIEEIEVEDTNDDGIITEDEINFIDSDNDGTPDYLDPNVF